MDHAIDIGSTIVKVAENGRAHAQYLRDFDGGIEAQVNGVIDAIRGRDPQARFRICSSANGGLRVGILCLTSRFSGRIAANLASAAGANVIFLHGMNGNGAVTAEAIDALVLVGGTDGSDAGQLERHLDAIDLSDFDFQILVYAGNNVMAGAFRRRYPAMRVVANPLGPNLELINTGLLDMLRDAYLDDLIQKDGVAALQGSSEVPIRPTPAVVNAAFRILSTRRAGPAFPLPFLLVDIGGATTDVHFGVELLSATSRVRLEGFLDDNRYVFAELGVSASRDSTVVRLAEHPGLHDFLTAFDADRTRELYRAVVEGEAPDVLMPYACYFLALDGVGVGHSGDRPALRIDKANAIVVTGGALQDADAAILKRIGRLLVHSDATAPDVIFDRDYSLWTLGLTYDS